MSAPEVISGYLSLYLLALLFLPVWGLGKGLLWYVRRDLRQRDEADLAHFRITGQTSREELPCNACRDVALDTLWRRVNALSEEAGWKEL